MDVRDWFYYTPEWRSCRKTYIKIRESIDGGLCEMCHEEKGSHVHHKEELNNENVNNAFISLSHKNLMLLCRSCHEKKHGRNKKDDQRLMFDDDGMPIRL